MRAKQPMNALFEPGRIGGMQLKNRLVMPPMVTNFATSDGYATEKMKGFYEKRSQGGVGLVITEAACVDTRIGKTQPWQLGIDDDRFVPGLNELAYAVKKHGAKVAIQLHHAGRGARLVTLGGLQPVAPSPVAVPYAAPGFYGVPRELTVGEIADIVGRFARAAERVIRSGFDGIEIHSASGYLVNQFLSPASNHRQDQYGGNLENRARFLLDIIKAIRTVVGSNYPVWIRLNCREYGVDGLTLEDACVAAKMAEESGADAIHPTAYGFGTGANAAARPETGFLVDMIAKIKKSVRAPVIAVGRIDPDLGERLLLEGKADFIAMGRALLADPELPNKAESGRLEDIAPCIACLHCVHRVTFLEKDIECAVNPAVGKEQESEITPAKRPKRVVVVGGGPAGMEAARVAALRGHEVTLFEKQPTLGGQLNLAVIPPHKDTIRPLTSYLAGQVKKAGVRLEMIKEATPAVVEELSPDVVIIATGVVPVMPEIPGITEARTVTAEAVLLGKIEVGQKVIIIGGELVGCETADFLAARGKNVTVVRRGPRMATGMMPLFRRELLGRLRERGVNLLTGVRYDGITSNSLSITTKESQHQVLEADTIVPAAGSRPCQELYGALKGKGPEIHLVGDCATPQGIREAISDGFRVALKV